MSLVINTNTMSLNAQRNLSTSQTQMATSLERLSSGLRINSAKDDAAGLAISQRMTTQINGLNQAVRNANDGISLAQTAEGALGEMNANLQRIRELAVQSANATNSNADRVALDQEVQQRLAEIDRIANQTSFNGRNVLDGTFGDALFQVGANVGQTISVNLDTSMRLDSVGAVAQATSVDTDTIFTEAGDDTAATYTTGDVSALAADLSSAGTGGSATTIAIANDGTNPTAADFSTNNAVFEVDGFEITLTADYSSATDASAIATDIQTALDGEFGAGAYTVADSGFDIDITNNLSAESVDITNANTYADAAGIVNATGSAGTVGTLSFDVDSTTVTLDGNYATQQEVADAIQTQLGSDYEVSVDGTSLVIATAATGSSETAPVIDNFSGVGSALLDGGTSVAGADGDPAGSITVADDFSIQIGDADAVAVANGEYTSAQDLVDAMNLALAGEGLASINDDGTITLTSQSTITVSGDVGVTELGFAAETTASGDLTSANVLDVDAANDTIYRVDSALTSVSDLRSTFGAVQNRFESTIANLSSTVENLSSARSRVMDADFAAETAELTRTQILQQAGVSVLAQANMQPQMALSLLQ